MPCVIIYLVCSIKGEDCNELVHVTVLVKDLQSF